MTMASSGSATVEARGDTEILITRRFAAAPPLVWRAWTEPELIRRWWHANRGEMTVCEVDLRVGGRWRYAMVTPDGQDVAFHGEYREVEAPGRLVSTEVYEAVPDAMAVNLATFEDDGEGGTLLRILVTHEDRTGRDMHLNSGMEDGLQDALDMVEGVAGELGS